MFSSKITSKGQTTIPAAVRDFMNLHTGDEIKFITQENGKVLLVSATDVTELKGMLPRPKKMVTTQEMDTAMKKHLADKYKNI